MSWDFAGAVCRGQAVRSSVWLAAPCFGVSGRSAGKTSARVGGKVKAPRVPDLNQPAGGIIYVRENSRPVC